ncbi:hypothetical protein DFH09DRAFT_1306882 [Mycena vulgaris]|nr:hypothetical protein DFH09DRAFT_1306882 [Mycena vulgaris]
MALLEALESIVETHELLPFRVFDMDDSLVVPADIPAKLKGALNGGLTDSFTAIVDQIVILKAPPIQPRNNYARLDKLFRYSVLAVGVFSTPTVRPPIIPLSSNASLPPVHPANGPQPAVGPGAVEKFSGDGEMPADDAGDAGKAPESPEPTVDGGKGSGGRRERFRSQTNG